MLLFFFLLLFSPMAGIDLVTRQQQGSQFYLYFFLSLLHDRWAGICSRLNGPAKYLDIPDINVLFMVATVYLNHL